MRIFIEEELTDLDEGYLEERINSSLKILNLGKVNLFNKY